VIPATKAKVDDSKLKRVSFTTNQLLFEGPEFKVNESVRDMLYSFRSKYRIFLITRVDREDGEQYKAAQACFA
jgi:hypothetical protein